MFEYLIDHARRNVWCAPQQDLQVIFKPMKINRPTGSVVSAPHLWLRLDMPSKVGYYHLYQIGQLAPHLVGLLPDVRTWVKLSDVMTQENLIVDLYVNNGLHLPCGTSYYRFTEERNLVLAVEDHPEITDLRTEALYVRFYSNSYFNSVRSDSFLHNIQCRYMKMRNDTEGLQFQTIYHQFRDRPVGHTKLFVNGAYVNDFVPMLTAPGSILELVYDSTIKAVVDFPIATAPNFDSDLDLKRKYLLHHTGAQNTGPVIDYRDDSDIFLIRPYLRGGHVPSFEGIYYHRNQDDAVRMVTHRDMTIVVPYVQNYQLQRPGWTDVHELTARVFLRHSGWQRELVDEHSRIRDLYRLPAGDVVNAMFGVDATVPVWQVANLENAQYPAIMRADGSLITSSMVQSAYGYNAIAKLMADTPQFVENVNGRRQVSLPPGLHQNSTVFEYDAQGLLLGYQQHTLGSEYTPRFAACVMIEALVGRPLSHLTPVVDEAISDINPELNYRFYKAEKVGDLILHETWEDVTGDEASVAIVDDQAAWSVDYNTTTTLMIDDLDFVCYSLVLSPENGLLKFSVNHGRPHQYIPPGKIDVWLNGHALIETIDYRVVWPQVVIFNKEFLQPGSAQGITVRCTGFCNSDLSREEPAERGWVKHGQLSRNGYYNLRDDKVIRIVVRGRTYERTQTEFVEDGIGHRLPDSMNGYPYLIENVVVPLRGLVDGEDTYSYRAKSLIVDEQVADYLSLRLAEPTEPNPNMSLELYSVYSPFSSTLIHDIVNGIFSMAQFQGHYSDADVLDSLESYRYLLDYDPTQFALDDRFMIVHPHNLLTEIRLDIYQYNFVARAVKVFLDDKVDLSRFLVIE